MNVKVMQNPGLSAIILVCSILVSSGVSSAATLNQPCPVEWRGTPLIDAIQNLSKRLDVPYMLDSSVTDDMLRRPVRMNTTRLTGRQAFRWTVRSVGLDAIWVNGAMMIAVPERLPLTWRVMGVVGGSGNGASPMPWDSADASKVKLEALAPEARSADLSWVDAPLSRVAKDISEKFGLDVVFHPAIQADEPLVRLEGAGLNLEAIRIAFAEQIRATCRYDDGAIWVEVSGAASSQEPLTQPETALATVFMTSQPDLLSRAAPINLPGGGWESLRRAFERAGAVECRIKAHPDAEPSFWAANGTIFAVLEGMRLLEGWNWRLEPMNSGGLPVLVITVPDH